MESGELARAFTSRTADDVLDELADVLVEIAARAETPRVAGALLRGARAIQEYAEAHPA